ncbi:syntaxin-18 isoform X1 [Hydra vulgaris]|uniref:Syntaxin-18 n=1 Tax=Hydra vulgaris TaxID=6087 RepID=T2M4H1_HYDVU|nr:syntaxin-18 [Hydra vulgaris]
MLLNYYANMEITKVFEACVKAVRVKKKEFSPTTNILPKSKKNRDTFNSHAQAVVQSISQLRDFLITYQTDYLSEFSHLPSLSGKLTDIERDQIDNDSQKLMKSCSTAIESLKNEVTFGNNSQSRLHSTAVVELLQTFLKDVCRLYSQLRAYRVKLAVDRKRMALLNQSRQNDRLDVVNSKTEVLKKILNEKECDQKIFDKNKDKPLQDEMGRVEQKKKEVIKDTGSIVHDFEQEESEDVYKFTKEETQLFEEENERLFSEMNTMMKEVRNIEGKVIEISQLQEIFQEKVLAQSSQIQNIHNSAVATTENVKDGNEQIRDAIKNSATFRVWILFFLVMCTFSLLFLDWYNY